MCLYQVLLSNKKAVIMLVMSAAIFKTACPNDNFTVDPIGENIEEKRNIRQKKYLPFLTMILALWRTRFASFTLAH